MDERHKAQQTERRIQEENELLRLESGSLRATMKEAVAKAQKTASVIVYIIYIYVGQGERVRAKVKYGAC